MKSKYIMLITVLHLLYSSRILAFDLKNGDLLFQESYSGDRTGYAISNVTKSIDDYNFTHIGIVYIPKNDSVIYVIEATPPMVQIIPLMDFLYKNRKEEMIPKTVVGRINDKYQHLIPGAINEGLKLIGKKYDYGFDIFNDQYYCSELIYYIFLKSNNGTPIFDLNAMTFKKNNSDDFHESWIQYFHERDLQIPEGNAGINPGAISLTDKIEILGEIVI